MRADQQKWGSSDLWGLHQKNQIATEENFTEEVVIKWRKPGWFYDWILNC